MLHNAAMISTPTGVSARLALSIVGVFAACSAHATLGEGAGSVLADQAALHGSLRTREEPQFTVQEIATDSGLLVREFAAPDGMVFAISWSGPALPGLKQLLGAYHADYLRAQSQLGRPGLKRNVSLATGDVLVEQGGHLRAYIGRAVLLTRIPGGVALAQLH
jgi:Protein of unknown function (DUF2844)